MSTANLKHCPYCMGRSIKRRTKKRACKQPYKYLCKNCDAHFNQPILKETVAVCRTHRSRSELTGIYLKMLLLKLENPKLNQKKLAVYCFESEYIASRFYNEVWKEVKPYITA